jgi:hypothetical protein
MFRINGRLRTENRVELCRQSAPSRGGRYRQYRRVAGVGTVSAVLVPTSVPTGADRQLMVPTCADRDCRGRGLGGRGTPRAARLYRYQNCSSGIFQSASTVFYLAPTWLDVRHDGCKMLSRPFRMRPNRPTRGGSVATPLLCSDLSARANKGPHTMKTQRHNPELHEGCMRVHRLHPCYIYGS